MQSSNSWDEHYVTAGLPEKGSLHNANGFTLNGSEWNGLLGRISFEEYNPQIRRIPLSTIRESCKSVLTKNSLSY